MGNWDGVQVNDEDDLWDLLELRSGEFVVWGVDWRANSVKVSRDLGGDPCDEGPAEDFRRRGGGVHLLRPGDIVTRIRG